MARPRLSVIMLVIVSTMAAQNFGNPRKRSSIDQLRTELYDLGDLFVNPGTGPHGPRTYMRLIESYRNFTDNLDATWSAGNNYRRNSLDSLWLWANVKIHVDNVENLYAMFTSDLDDTVAGNETVNAKKWSKFAETILEDPIINVFTALNAIADVIVHDNLFVAVYQEAANQICDEQQSPQQLLYNLYKTIVLTEMKGWSMMQFSYTLLKLYNNGTFKEETKKTETEYYRRISETIRAVTTAMDFAPRELWRCDPSVHKEDSTFVELKQLIQGYIVNEVDLNTKSSCKENCGYYSLASVSGCYDNLYCSRQRPCMGKILKCQFVDSDMWVCPAPKHSSRRYEYIQYENGRVFGEKKACTTGQTKVDSWWRWLFWHCSYCMCYCDDNTTKSIRYFSLRDVVSDVENNRVITGLKLMKMNRIIHLQIQEGKLGPEGEIDETTVQWKKVDNFTISDRDVQSGRDFHTLAWERRAIDLDDLVAPDFQVLTGVRFRLVGAHLNFEIRVTPFNYTDGHLIRPIDKSTWMSNDMTDVKHPTSLDPARTELKLEKPDVPTRGRAPSHPDSKTNQYLNFGPTDFEKDAAQSTIPFLDIQPVVTNPPFPLAGAGVYHKGRGGSGGFVGLRIVTYDFGKHLRADSVHEQPILTRDESPRVNEILSF